MQKLTLRLSGSTLVLILCCITPLAAQDISDSAKQQIADILNLKRSLSQSQRKLSTSLIMAALKARNQAPGSIPDVLIQQNAIASDGVVVDVKADSVADAMTRINAAGGTILSTSDVGSVIRARIPILSLETVADSTAVRAIRTPAHARTNGVRHDLSPFSSLTGSDKWLEPRRKDILKAEVQAALPLLAATGYYPSMKSLLPLHINPFVGAVTSQGYVTHTANQAIALGFDGTGVRVGVLSDSASPGRVAALIASGDLPPDTVVLPGEAGPSDGTDEGAAMMEIIHDAAPGAKLFFATAFESQEGFAANIRTLRFTYHCDIIVDDVTFFEEGLFQDGIIASAVNDITADGGLYFSSAGNTGNATRGTSGTWEGDFKSGGDAGTLIDSFELGSVQVHNFNPSGTTLYNTFVIPSGFAILHWSDPLGASSNDYDAFLLNPAGTAILSFSTDTQNGTGDPIEELFDPSNPGAELPAGSRIVVVKYSGDTRALHIDTEGGLLAFSTDGATFAHNAGLNTVSIAATAWNSARRGTAVFSSANPTESFSSDGPRRIFFNPDGTPITPGNLLFGTNGGTVLQKPDLTAADGTFSKTPGFLPFYGTSAAAPHAAAIAALVKSANPALTNAQIKQIMIDTAVDTMAPGVDRDAGYGITMALPAVQAALAVR